MRLITLLLLALSAPAIAAPDNIINAPGSGQMFLQDSLNRVLPAQVVFTTDGSNHVIPLGGGGMSANVNVTNASLAVTQSGAWTTGRTWTLDRTTDSCAAYEGGTWDIRNVTGTVSLPTGAATAAKQDTGNASLASIDSKLANPLPISGSVTVSNFPAVQPVSATALPLPANACQESGGNLDLIETHVLSIDTKLPSGLSVLTGRLQVDGSGVTQPISASALPLPAGAATAAKQDTGNASLASIDSKLTNPLPVSVTNFPGTQPVSGTVAVSNFPATYAVTQSTSPWVTSRNWALTFAGDKADVTGSSVGVSNFPATQAVTESGTWNVGLNSGSNTIGKVDQGVGGASAWKVDGSAVTQPISGTVTVNQGTSPWVIDDLTFAADKVDASGSSVSVSNFPSTQAVTGTFWQSTQPVSAASLPLPTGAATAAKQPALGVAGTASTDVITIQGIASMTAVKVDGSGVTQPVSGTFWQATQPVSGTVAISNFPATQAVTQSTSPWVVGGAVAVGSAPVNPPVSISGVDGGGLKRHILTRTDGTTVVDGSGFTQPVSGTFWQATQPISAASLPLPTGASTSAKQPALGTAGSASADVITVQGVASMTALKVDGSAVTQPISAASLPLPSGAATAAKQPALGSAGSASADVITVQGVASMTALKVDGSAVTQPISAASLPLPSGAATAANQTTANTSLAAIDAGIPAGLGQTTMANSMPVVIASDQSTIPVSGTVTVSTNSVASSSITRVTASATNVTLLSSNASRKAFILYNESTSVAYVKFGATASATSYTVQMARNSYYSVDSTPIYTGQIDAIWSTANGAMMVTEL